MKKDTIVVRGTYKPKNGEPTNIPLHQSTTYAYDTSDDLGKLFKLEANGHIYSRISNPTVSYLEEKVNLLEGGVGCLAANSGHAAMVNIIFNLCKAGDHIVSSAKIYGGVYNLLSYTLPKYGITTTFFDPLESYEDVLAKCQPNTKLLFTEVLANPDMTLSNIDVLADVAKTADVPFVVDNTILSPIIYSPLEHGANIVVHSGTKYYDGHGSSLAGFIIDGGTYNYDNGKFLDFVKPDTSYGGLSYLEVFKEQAFIVKARTQFTRDFGNYLSPFNAYLINMNMETMSLRVKKQSENALLLAEFLEQHEKVEWVKYPLLQSHHQFDLAKSMMSYGGGVVSFGIKGSKEEASQFTDHLELAMIMAHFGDLRTGVIHPGSTTHSQLDDEALVHAGISPNFIRVSLGIEDIDDIIADFKQALDKCQ